MIASSKYLRPNRAGEKIAMIAASASIAATVVGCCLEFFPHTYLLEKYKNIYQMYRFGNEVPVPDNVKSLFDEVVSDLKLNKRTKQLVYPFTVCNFNLFHAGMTFTKTGAAIGIPINYSYNTKNDVETSLLKINLQDFNEHHPASDDLLDSLILSKEAKKFGIAREILMTDKNKPLFLSIITPFLIIGTSLASELTRIQFSLHNKPRSVKILAYGVTGLFGYAVWFQIRDALNTWMEKEVDEELSKISPEYVAGGREFYAKLLKRNAALRVLLGPNGTKAYNKDGDEIFFIRHKRTPITYRKKFFEEVDLNLKEASL